jgi:hypothetical protein
VCVRARARARLLPSCPLMLPQMLPVCVCVCVCVCARSRVRVCILTHFISDVTESICGSVRARRRRRAQTHTHTHTHTHTKLLVCKLHLYTHTHTHIHTHTHTHTHTQEASAAASGDTKKEDELTELKSSLAQQHLLLDAKEKELSEVRKTRQNKGKK